MLIDILKKCSFSNHYTLFFLLIISVLLVSCSPGNSNDNITDEINSYIRYARGFDIEVVDGMYKITVRNPWQGASEVNYEYILYKNEEDLNNYSIDENTIPVKIPVKTVACLSTSHIAIIDALDMTHTISGVSGIDYVYNQKVKNGIDLGKVKEIGYESNLNYEIIASLSPDIMIAYGVEGHVITNNIRIRELGVLPVMNADYLESSPLGKSEWIKFVAAFYDMRERGDSIFNNIEKEYLFFKELAKNVSYKPKVLTGLPWKGTWYVPGGNSFFARLINDAGGSYYWSRKETNESIPLDIENVFNMASEADVWINLGDIKSREDIKKIDDRFKSFPPYASAKIYNYDKRMNKDGGIDFWESSIINPQIVLKDLIKIFHPELLPDYELYYYRDLK